MEWWNKHRGSWNLLLFFWHIEILNGNLKAFNNLLDDSCASSERGNGSIVTVALKKTQNKSLILWWTGHRNTGKASDLRPNYSRFRCCCDSYRLSGSLSNPICSCSRFSGVTALYWNVEMALICHRTCQSAFYRPFLFNKKLLTATKWLHVKFLSRTDGSCY